MIESERSSPQPLPTVLDHVSEHPSERVPHRRRATLPSLVIPDDDTRSILATILPNNRAVNEPEVHPRPLSSKENSQQRTIIQAKRRSRSAGALRAVAQDHRMSPIQWSRASAELHHNESAATESVRPPTLTTIATERKESVSNSLHESSVSEAFPDTEPESVSYDVGHLVSSMQHDDNVTMEQRLTTLEVKLIDLEFAIARMQTPGDQSNRQKRTPSPEVARQQSRSNPSSSRETASDSLQPGIPGEDRPVSTSTIRPSILQRARTLQTPSMSSLTDVSSISIEQYSALITLLRREQSARRNLENQVVALQEDMQRLQRVALHSMGSVGTMYPIRNSDSEEFLRFRRALDADSPPRTEEKIGGKFDSDSSDVALHSDINSDDVFSRPKWDRSQRIEVAGMI